MGFMSATNLAVLAASLVVDVPTKKKTVTYFIDTSASYKDPLGIPYAVAVDGHVLSAYQAQPKRARGKPGKIVVKDLVPGNKVRLYLNSDAASSYRKVPVYAVEVGDHDIKVRIKEVLGKLATLDTLNLVSTHQKKSVTTYTATLTGDIWMKVSHRYDVSEVAGLLPPGARAEVKAAVTTIYQGLIDNKLTLDIAAKGNEPASRLVVTFVDSSNANEPSNSNNSSNAKQNIMSYGLLNDGLPRVHPAGYAAVLEAALAAGLATLTMISCWRPCLGSIAHRAGLGLDVSMLGNVTLNRQELHVDPSKHSYNVTPKEKELYEVLEAARSYEQSANAAWKQADASREDDAENRDAVERAEQDARATLAKASDARGEAEEAWANERDEHEPYIVNLFRAALAASPASAQIFDPWLMEADTHHHGRTTGNRQEDENERKHANHLHLTVYEPRILTLGQRK